MHSNPKIKPAKDTIDRVLEIASLVFLCLLWAFVVYSYNTLPETIPTHFNAVGEPDGYGEKSTLFILPVLATLIYFGMGWINQYPYKFNYTVVINEGNAASQYKLATRLLRVLKLVVLIVFIAIVLFTHLTISGKTAGIGSWFLPVAIALIMVPTLFSLYTGFKKKA
jgi:uncharacterized membrane protein